jgi:RNA polymerase sigma-70 factor (ECF subfamily)
VNDDSQLIDEALAGNSASFGQLVRRYQDRLYNTMFHVVHCAEEAQDVVQEAFVQAFVKLDTFQRNSAFYTWLYRIAFNTAVSRKRRHRPMASVEQSRQAAGTEPIDGREAPHERLEQEERVKQVRAALAALSEEHRAILVLREMEGCDYETIAAMLDLPVGTVRSRLHRARLQLRDQLQEMLRNEIDEPLTPNHAVPRPAEDAVSRASPSPPAG